MSIKRVGLDVEPFGQVIDVFFNIKNTDDLKVINSFIKSKYSPLQDEEIDYEALTLAGSFYYFPCEEGIYRCIILKNFDLKNIDNCCNFVHELYHAIYHVLDQVEVETSDKFNELTAYLLDCNLGKFLKAIKDKKYEKLGDSK